MDAVHPRTLKRPSATSPFQCRPRDRRISPHAGFDAYHNRGKPIHVAPDCGNGRAAVRGHGGYLCSNIAMVEVVAAIMERDGRILIGQRRPEQSHALKWELPGGKVEGGETPAQALTRELPKRNCALPAR